MDCSCCYHEGGENQRSLYSLVFSPHLRQRVLDGSSLLAVRFASCLNTLWHDNRWHKSRELLNAPTQRKSARAEPGSTPNHKDHACCFLGWLKCSPCLCAISIAVPAARRARTRAKGKGDADDL